MIIMKGTAPAHICTFFSGTRNGKVEMVNSKGIYLELADKRILLCSSRFGVVPNGAALERWEILPQLLFMDQPIQVSGSILRFPFGKVFLDLQPVQNDISMTAPDRESLMAAVEMLRSGKKSTGLAPLVYPLFLGEQTPQSPLCQVALPKLTALLDAIAQEDVPGIHKKLEGLLGLGPGLTPSGDDVISGLMYGLRHSSWRDSAVSATLKDSVLKLANKNTNAVSAAYLKALAMDAPFEKIASAWRDPAHYAAELLNIGSNSGSEMLLGLLLAGKLLGYLT